LGFDELKMEIYRQLPKWNRDTVLLPMSEYGMSIVSWLFNEGIVHNVNYEDRIIVDFEARDEIILKAKLIEKKDKHGQ